MMSSLYESHMYPNPSSPFLYHATIIDDQYQFLLHWHENLELLFITDGSMKISMDTKQYIAQKGDLVIINSNCTHYVHNDTLGCRYACLIIDFQFCESLGFPVSTCSIQPVVTSDEIHHLFYRIIEEFQLARPFQKQMLKSMIMTLITELFRNYLLPGKDVNSEENSKSLKAIQHAIFYMRKHSNESISIEDIANELGFSKYYFCRIFKKITMHSPIHYLNLIRCKNAQRMLVDDILTIREIAACCGFENASYFTRIYKKHMKVLPSEERRLSQIQSNDKIKNVLYSNTNIYPSAIEQHKETLPLDKTIP